MWELAGAQSWSWQPPCPQDYQRMLDLMRDIILATDLAHHLRIFKDLQKMAEGEDPGMEIGIGI